MKMKPMGDQILVKKQEGQEKTKSGIILTSGTANYEYADVIAVGPGLFTGAIMLGTVVQVSNAFQRVHGSFDLFLQNWTTITELRSIIKRLSEFERNLSIHNKAVSA